MELVKSSEFVFRYAYLLYNKFDRTPFIIYADLECLIEKIVGCKNISENLSTSEVRKHIPSGFSMSKD